MELIDLLQEMDAISNPNIASLKSYLEEDYHVICGDNNNFGYAMAKYDLFIEDGVLFAGTLSDSSTTEVVITLEMATLYNDNALKGLWDSYLSGKDFFLVDVKGDMHEARINTGQFDLGTIKSQIKPGQIIQFNNVYSTPHLDGQPDTKVYVEDNSEAPFVGLDAVKVAIENVPNTYYVTSKSEADFTILILKNATKAPHQDFFEWLNDDNKDVAVVKETLAKKNIAYNGNHKVLLYWSSNVFMMGLMDSNKAMYKAAMELGNAIKEYHKG